MENFLGSEEVPFRSSWEDDIIVSHIQENLHVKKRDIHGFVDLLHTQAITTCHASTLFNYNTHLFYVHVTKIRRGHGIICVDINALLFIE